MATRSIHRIPTMLILLISAALLLGCGLIGGGDGGEAPQGGPAPAPAPVPEGPRYVFVEDSPGTALSPIDAEAAALCDDSIRAAIDCLNRYDGQWPELAVSAYDPSRHHRALERLTVEQQRVYLQMESALASFGDYRIDDNELSGGASTFLTAYDALMLDHPEFAIYSSIGYDWPYEVPVYFMPGKDGNTPSSDRAAVQQAANHEIELYQATIDRVIAKMPAGLSDSQKALYLAAFLSYHCSYDQSGKAVLAPWQPYTALVRRSAVCKGYATAMQELMKAAGLESRVQTGTAPSEGEHAWVSVETPEGTRYIDPTWMDDETTWPDMSWFLLDRGTMERAGYAFFPDDPNYNL
ncbi:MAG: hypothetical protein IJJ14_00010 [Coriobacteriales bacterium]|nr:hypothetical protein [Coriobacteriales bacterium]